MTKFINVVRVVVKEVYKQEYLKKVNEMPKFKGMLSSKIIETGPHHYCMIGEWESENHIAKARPQMIEFLDSVRSLLEEISPELGVTDPISGPIIAEK